MVVVAVGMAVAVVVAVCVRGCRLADVSVSESRGGGARSEAGMAESTETVAVAVTGMAVTEMVGSATVHTHIGSPRSGHGS